MTHSKENTKVGSRTSYYSAWPDNQYNQYTWPTIIRSEGTRHGSSSQSAAWLTINKGGSQSIKATQRQQKRLQSKKDVSQSKKSIHNQQRRLTNNKRAAQPTRVTHFHCKWLTTLPWVTQDSTKVTYQGDLQSRWPTIKLTFTQSTKTKQSITCLYKNSGSPTVTEKEKSGGSQ